MHLRNLLTAALTALLLGVAGCAGLPAVDERPPSAYLRDTSATRLARAIQPSLAAHPGQTGVALLRDGADAFTIRRTLADAAERSLDIQCYIWRDDTSGELMFDALRRAARRGVRVRLLLDDINTQGLDAKLFALDRIPGIEVRLFNPFANRSWRFIEMVTDFHRVNRRMHNKSFTADNQATIIGGRNIGDEYFDATPGIAFVDLDVLAVGPVVEQVSKDFDRYWASSLAYPVRRLLTEAPAADASAGRVPPAPEPPAESPIGRRLLAGTLPMQWSPVRLVSDDPAKAEQRATTTPNVLEQLRDVVGEPQRELLAVSPYFVPTERGMRIFADWARRGVQVSVLTNSLAANDVPAVHAGYSDRRKPLLEAGVRLFELKPEPIRPRTPRRYGSSGASLHSKAFAVDRARVFIGSLNFDPRSRDLNTEMGFVIDSPVLARELAAMFAADARDKAYEVTLTPEGELQWQDRRNGSPRTLDSEPDADLWTRFWVWLLSWLPLDWMM